LAWDETASAELAVPTRAIMRDGLQHVFFLRESVGAPRVIRVEAKLGPSDGRWTVVYSGPMEGDEVVVDGAYELNLAGTGAMGGGHFHADGTFHADDH
jgi:multidrug efflux pump subunit AcrA (membrane-fusion protein)